MVKKKTEESGCEIQVKAPFLHFHPSSLILQGSLLSVGFFGILLQMPFFFLVELLDQLTDLSAGLWPSVHPAVYTTALFCEGSAFLSPNGLYGGLSFPDGEKL